MGMPPRPVEEQRLRFAFGNSRSLLPCVRGIGLAASCRGVWSAMLIEGLLWFGCEFRRSEAVSVRSSSLHHDREHREPGGREPAALLTWTWLLPPTCARTLLEGAEGG